MLQSLSLCGEGKREGRGAGNCDDITVSLSQVLSIVFVASTCITYKLRVEWNLEDNIIVSEITTDNPVNFATKSV